MKDHESNWPRQLLIGLSALLAVGLLIGGIVGVIAVKATDVAGVGEVGPTEQQTLALPDASPSPSGASPSAGAAASGSPSAEPSSAATKKPARTGTGDKAAQSGKDKKSQSKNRSKNRSKSKSKNDDQKQKQKQKKDKKKKKRAGGNAIVLSASPRSVGSFDRINLTGRFRGGNGRTLSVQRYEGAWVNFPTAATVSGGTFSTYVASGQPGQNRFRMVDVGSRRTSNPVSVNVGR